MWPTKKEWRRWNALNKMNYVAQLLAPVALVVSSAFSYLGWMEARRSQEIQQRIFATQSGPMLKISDVHMETVSDGRPALIFSLKNIGESDASKACFEIFSIGLNQRAGGTCGKGPLGEVSLRKEQTFVYPLPIDQDPRRAIGFVPVSARVITVGVLGEPCPATSSTTVLIVTYRYEDVFSNKRGGLDQVLLCGSGHQASATILSAPAR